MTRRELLARLDSRELTEWRAYATVEPFGEERADRRAALICMVMANLQKGKKQPAFELDDFMLQFGEADEPLTPEQMMTAFALATGARR